MASMSPAPVDGRFCPLRRRSQVSFPRSLTCHACDDRALWSPEPVTATMPRDDEGRIWLLQRAHHGGGGRWTFPGGFVELGKSVRDATCRETREKLQIEVDLGGLIGIYSCGRKTGAFAWCSPRRPWRAARNGGGDRGARVRTRRPAVGRAVVLVDEPGAARPLAAG
jgi:8-oxo-dGTP pyrophosphatase MutT (NUDIX family)